MESVVIDAFAAEPGGTFSAIMSLSANIGMERSPLNDSPKVLEERKCRVAEALERRFAVFACEAGTSLLMPAFFLTLSNFTSLVVKGDR